MLFAGLFAVLLSANLSEMMIPPGTILPVVLNETLNTKRIQENDPILFSLAEDIRAAGHRGPILIPRGSSVVGIIARTDRAGHFFGRSTVDIAVQEIITPTGEVYDGVSAKIVDVANKKGLKGEVKADGGLQGPVHRTRDTLLLLFPPTTLFQLLAIPKRGPDVVLPVETRLYVKLMTPIYVQTGQTGQRITESFPQAVPAPVPAAPPAPVPLPASAPFPELVPQPAPQAAIAMSQNGVEILVAPVALYPDAILRDLLRATTHPFEIVQANQWVHQSRDAWGSLPLNGYNESWDQSVKALTAYPELLQRMTADADWMMRLGTVYTTQPLEVLSAVQRLRMRANSVKGAATVKVANGGR